MLSESIVSLLLLYPTHFSHPVECITLIRKHLHLDPPFSPLHCTMCSGILVNTTVCSLLRRMNESGNEGKPPTQTHHPSILLPDAMQHLESLVLISLRE